MVLDFIKYSLVSLTRENGGYFFAPTFDQNIWYIQ